jgi:hypothetical protein
MLSTAGFDTDTAVGGLTAFSLLGIGGLLALPFFALPAMLAGAPASPGLVHTALLGAAGRLGFDFGCLLTALRATGARPHPSLVLLAYSAAGILALLPLTPGGLGIVEASLSGLLVLAGRKQPAASGRPGSLVAKRQLARHGPAPSSPSGTRLSRGSSSAPGGTATRKTRRSSRSSNTDRPRRPVMLDQQRLPDQRTTSCIRLTPARRSDSDLGRPSGPLSGGLAHQPVVQFDGEPVDLAGQLGIGFEFQFLFVEVAVGLGLLECRLPVLADHDERG